MNTFAKIFKKTIKMKKINLLGLMVVFTTISMAQNGINFDGVDDYVQTNYEGISGDAARSIEAYIRTEVTTHPGDGGVQNVIVDWGTMATGQRFTFNVLFNNALRIEIQGSGLSGTIPVNDGDWHHVAVTFDPEIENSYKLYVDGVLDVEGDLETAISTGSGIDMRIGARIQDGKYFTGDIDEVRVWNYARSIDQINEDMNREFCEVQEGLVAYYKFNQGEAFGSNPAELIAYDLVDGHDGDLLDFALEGESSNWVIGADLEVGFVTSEFDVIGCGSYTVPSGDATYDEPGTYEDIIPSVFGCDSIMTINVTIAEPTFSTIDTVICGGSIYETPSGEELAETGEYLDIILNDAGCDSTITINLTVLEAAVSTIDTIICAGESYTVPSGEAIYEESGAYTDVILSESGCDSTITINLTVLDHSIIEITEEVCDLYTSPAGIDYTESGDYAEVYTYESGCDSVTYQLSIIVNESTSSIIDVTSCGVYTSPAGMEYDESGEYVETLENEVGCDSIITINLTVIEIDPMVTVEDPILTANQEGVAYQWVDCDADYEPIDGATDQVFEPTENGNYAVILTDGECVDTSDCYTIATVGIDEINQIAFSAFPNPTTGTITITFGELVQNGTIAVLSVDGAVVQMSEINNQDQILLDINQPNGIYFLQLLTADQTGIIKIVNN